jgi:hypothetical protein
MKTSLEYVVRPQLKGPYDAPEDGPEDPPPFGDPDSPYVTIDAELTTHAPILLGGPLIILAKNNCSK